MKRTNIRIKSLILLVAVFCTVAIGFGRLYRNQLPKFKASETVRGGAPALLLDQNTPPYSFSSFLLEEGYIDDPEEAAFISSHITGKMAEHGPMDDINDLYKDDGFALHLNDGIRDSLLRFPGLGDRIRVHEQALGLCDTVDRIIADTSYVNPVLSEDGPGYRIRIKQGGPFSKLFGKAVSEPVVLRITRYWNKDNEWAREIAAYVRCEDGKATVRLPGLASDGTPCYYSVLPIQRGYRFGPEAPTYRNWKRRMTFYRSEDLIMPFDKVTVRDMKDDGKLAIRTGSDYKAGIMTVFFVWMIAWMIVFFALLVADYNKSTVSNYLLVDILAALTGISLLVLFSIPGRPLQDAISATGQLRGLLIGVVGMTVFSIIDWGKASASLSFNRFFSIPPYNRGVFYACLAVGLLILTALLGSGPGGAKVNLFNVQPAPVIKYLTIIGLSLILGQRRDYIEAFGKGKDRYSKGRYLKVLLKAIALIAVCLFAQVVLLSDMGPFVVILVTGILMFSMIRMDLGQTVLGVASFVLLLWAGNRLFGIALWWVIAFTIWLGIWVVYCRFVRKEFCEGALLFNLVIICVLYGGVILGHIPGLGSAAERLNSRAESHFSPFLNESGSDQTARALWAMAEGGLAGDPGNTMIASLPACETDMIYPAIVSTHGAILGTAVLFLFVWFVIFGFRSALASKSYTSFYILSGITISVVVQACLILFGATNLTVLTGIPLPFVSYSSSHLAIDLWAAGLLVGFNRWGAKSGFDSVGVNKAYGRSTLLLIHLTVAALAAVLVATLYYSVIRRYKTTFKEAVVTNRRGERTVVDSPQIYKLTHRDLLPGRCFDVNGELLAGTDAHGRRTYPFGDQAFFWTGDLPSKCLFQGVGPVSHGVLAEPRFFSALRNFNNHPKSIEVTTHQQPSRYHPTIPCERTDRLTVYDYSELKPILKGDITVEEWNDDIEARDMHLTLDAGLLQSIASAIETFFHENSGAILPQTRFSLAMIDAATGDVLCTVCYPLADKDRIQKMAEAGIHVYRDDQDEDFVAFPDMDLALYPTSPGSIIKLLVAAAGLKKKGPAMMDHRERVLLSELIYHRGDTTRTGWKNLKQALRESNNPFMIKVLNNLDLYREYGTICWECGIPFNGRLPYCLYPDEIVTGRDDYMKGVEEARREGLDKWRIYTDEGVARKLGDSEWMLAWGQGARITASPLGVARLVGACANNGVLMASRYTSRDSLYAKSRILTEEEASLLQECMRYQNNGAFRAFSSTIGTKTGTPERAWKGGKLNDAWHTFFYDGSENPKNGHPISVCLRFERVMASSSLAVAFTKKLLPVLQDNGYLLTLGQ